jgi:MFS family permease
MAEEGKPLRVALPPDARRIFWAQGLRAFAYGLGAVLLGGTLKERGFSSLQSGFLLAAIVGGTIVASVVLARWADRIGRRRCYVALYLLLAVSGAVFALSDALWVLVLVALAGALSVDVIESGPFTSLEQAMLDSDLGELRRLRGFGTYNAVAAVAGSLGALAASGLAALRHRFPLAPTSQHAFLLFVPVALAGALVAGALTPAVEAPARPAEAGARSALAGSRRRVLRLSALFATDSLGGGFVVQAFIAYWLTVRFGASIGLLGLVFFAVGVLQTVSFLAAPRLAERFGLLNTMVFTHLPSNLALAAIAFAPNLGVAIALLMARVVLSQMDVPTRQAYVMALVAPEERTAAAAYTNTARYLTRPVGPLLAGATQALAIGAPFLIAGSIKSAYDLVLWRWFRNVELPSPAPENKEVQRDRVPENRRCTACRAGRVPGLDRRCKVGPPGSRDPGGTRARTGHGQRGDCGHHHLALPRGPRRVDRHT